MDSLFELDRLGPRLWTYVERSQTLKPEARRWLEEALARGQFERGDAARIAGLPDRSARHVLPSLAARRRDFFDWGAGAPEPTSPHLSLG
jgi:hypothetical protein